LYETVAAWETGAESAGKRPSEEFPQYESRFLEAINEDLNMPKALGVMWEMIRSDAPNPAKARVLFKMDEILGLNIQEISMHLKREQGIVPDFIKELVREREALRKQKKFSAADQLRAKIEKQGYELEDSKKGIKIKKKI
jgi:cysteinyl-tRNA synthetase